MSDGMPFLLFVVGYIIVGGATIGVIDAVHTWPNRNTPCNVQTFPEGMLFFCLFFWPMAWLAAIAYGSYCASRMIVIFLEPRGAFVKMMRERDRIRSEFESLAKRVGI